MDRAAILACPIMVVGVVMYAAPPNQVSEETPPREGDRIGRCRCWLMNVDFDPSDARPLYPGLCCKTLFGGA